MIGLWYKYSLWAEYGLEKDLSIQRGQRSR
jgi:hypothetical protein